MNSHVYMFCMPKRGQTARNTAGRRVLRELLRQHSQVEVALRIGAKQQYVSAWARGQSRPEPQYRDALVREYADAGFTDDCWYTDREHAIAHGTQSSPTLPEDDANLHARTG